jgi:hypothetical protein
MYTKWPQIIPNEHTYTKWPQNMYTTWPQIIPNEHTYTKWPQNIPNDHKIYQMATKYTKLT